MLRRFHSQSAFVEDFAKRHVTLSPLQRTLLGAGSGVVSFFDPTRGDMISCFGETTGEKALVRCLQKMQSTNEGKRILDEKPRINTGTVDLSRLRALPEGTVGRVYVGFLDKYELCPDDRPAVQYVNDVQLAYVMQRYREVHDLFHATLLMPITMLGEVSVKWFEAIQLQLPMCITGAIFGAFRLRPKHRKLYLDKYMKWSIQNGTNARFLLGIYFEERWEQPLKDFHKEMNIKPLQ